MKQIYDVPTQLKEKYIRFLEEICRIETPSGNVENINKMADVIEEFARALGFETQRYPFSASGDYLKITLPGDPVRKSVLMMAHMDTVHKVGSFGENSVVRDGDMLYGPGVSDCKGGIATGLLAMELMQAKEKHRSVVFLLTPDEEVSGSLSGETGISLIKETAANAAAVFNMEPGQPGCVTVGRKGILKFRVDVTGVSAHAGNGYFVGASAIKEAAHMILEIEGYSKEGGPTFNCGVISGGTTVNTIPEKCTFEVDVRVSDAAEAEKCRELVLKQEHTTVVKGTKRKVLLYAYRPPMEKAEKNFWLLSKWNASAASLGIKEYQGVTRGGGSDAAYSVLMGTPTLCSCATVGRFEHSRKETLDLSTMTERVKLICATTDSIEE